jgi:hypothetical protein
MFSDADLQLAYKLGNVPFNMFPYPHFYIPDVFPADYYRRILQHLPDPEAMVPIEKARAVRGYKERFVLGLEDHHLATLPDNKRAFWEELRGWLVGGSFNALLMSKFKPLIDQRFPSTAGVQFYDEGLLVQDITDYKLGPHTDATRKVITVLFYLPRDESQRHLGTSIYLPNDPAFRCPGGPHYNRDQFTRLHTNPFAPNSMFAFFKTDNSFHGVEPVADPDCRRWLLLYDIYVRTDTPAAPAFVAAHASNIRFKF